MSLFEFFGLVGNLRQLLGKSDGRQGWRRAWFTPNAMASLAKLRHRAVISHQERLTRLAIVDILTTFWVIAFADTAIVVLKYRWDINAIRARHAVLASSARYEGVVYHHLCSIHEQLIFLIANFNQWRIGTNVILQVFHIGHSASTVSILAGVPA